MINLMIINFKVRLNKGIEKLFWKIGFHPSSNQLVIQKQRYVLAWDQKIQRTVMKNKSKIKELNESQSDEYLYKLAPANPFFPPFFPPSHALGF